MSEERDDFRGWPIVPYAAAWLPYLAAYLLVFSSVGLATWLALRAALANVVPAALLGLAIPRLGARVTAGAPGPRAFLVRHALLGLGFAVTATAGNAGLVTLDRLVSGSRGGYDISVLAWQCFLGLLVYVALSGVAHASAAAERTRRAAGRAARAEALRAQAELAALRAQLNPHFLLNALHSVLGLVRRDPERAEAALERLGDLLRYALRVHRHGVDEVALEEEWEFVATYLELEALRLGDRLRSELRRDESTSGCVVPTFVLQVLVENAIRHAIAPRAAGGRVRIEARRDRDALELLVEDDGPGPITGVPTGAEAGASGGGNGLGLRLLADRLRALYGTRARLDAGAVPGGGFRAAVRLPCAGSGSVTDAREEAGAA